MKALNIYRHFHEIIPPSDHLNTIYSKNKGKVKKILHLEDDNFTFMPSVSSFEGWTAEKSLFKKMKF